MDYLAEGINQGNLIITTIIMIFLVIASTKARVLDSAGVAAAVLVGFGWTTRPLDMVANSVSIFGFLPSSDKMEI